MSYQFDAVKVKNQCVNWIREFFEKNGPDCNAIIGISGGKDSSIVAALCVEALGKDRVIGVLMPNGEQPDIDVARELVEFLGIKSYTINIQAACQAVKQSVSNELGDWSEQSRVNMPARIRMTTLYAVAQTMNGRVANTCNLSEDWVGYSTRYGDAAGDFSPLSHMTVTEAKDVGRVIGLPFKFIDKIPTDGLCDKTDEENLGFSYEKDLDPYIREDIEPEPEKKTRIDTLHEKNLFKLQLMPCFVYQD